MPTSAVALLPLSEEQEAIVDLCRTFARDEIRPIARAVDEADVETPWELWRKAAEVGITGFMLPEEYGGGGFTDVVTQCLVQEELCVGDLGIGNLLCSNGFFADPVLELGDDRQKKSWLTPLTGLDTSMTSVATTEPGSGSDAASIRTTAIRPPTKRLTATPFTKPSLISRFPISPTCPSSSLVPSRAKAAKPIGRIALSSGSASDRNSTSSGPRRPSATRAC